jgi:periplasmic protein TonB
VSLARLPLRTTALCAVALACALAACDKSTPAQKKTQQVKLLPDTPPPPPPPPKEEKKPEPQKEEKPQPQVAQPKPVDVPQPQALKSDEAAGDGPGNGLVAGSVTKDYAGETIGVGSVPEVGVSRLAFTSYANATTRSLNEFLAREKDLKLQDYKVAVNLWLDADGSVKRAELAGSTGDPAVDAALRTALARFPGSNARPPDNLPQPLRLRVSNRLMG